MSAIKTKRVETVIVDTAAAREIVANMVRTARKKAGLSQDTLALLIGVSRAQVASVETGRCWLGIEQFIKLLFVLDLKFSKATFT